MHRNVKLKIPEGAKVLEIGGGGLPHPRSSLIVDKFLVEDGKRQRGNADLVIDRPFVHADGCKLPFPDKSFDYVIASHVIEHIPAKDIYAFVSELNRIANAGYIEAPGPLYETLRDISEHVWFIVCADNVVHLCLKLKSDIPPQKRLINPMFYDPGYSPIINRHSDIWFTGMEWEGSFGVQIHESLNELWEFYNEKEIMDTIKERLSAEKTEERIFDPSFVSKIKRTAAWRMLRLVKRSCVKLISGVKEYVQPQRFYLPWREVVVCPYCMGQLNEQENVLECKACKLYFPILEGNIPSFVNSIKSKRI